MILTDKEIRVLSTNKENEQLPLITPFNEESLQSESYDLSIGTEIAVLKKEVSCIELQDQDRIDQIYELLDLTESGYVLSPNEYILVTINETVSLPEKITAHIRPRTRFTRLGLILCSQHLNSTYSGKLQLGLYNATNYAVRILPNIKIAQIVFEELINIPSNEKQYKYKRNAKYQNEKAFIGANFEGEFDKKIADAVRILFEEGE